MTDTTSPPTALKRAAAWLRGDGPAPAVSVGNPHGVASGAQFGRLSSVIDNAAMRSDRAKQCHDDARRRIDAALYDLEQLRQELGSIVDPKLIARAPDAPGAAVEPKAAAEADLKVGPERSERSAA